MPVTPSTKNLKYITECLHGSLLCLAYPEDDNNPKWLIRQHIDEVHRCLVAIVDDGEVNKMVYPLIHDIMLLLRKAKEIRDGGNPSQKNMFEADTSTNYDLTVTISEKESYYRAINRKSNKVNDS